MNCNLSRLSAMGAFVWVVCSGSSLAATTIKDINVTTDTSWTKANSPYVIQSDVKILSSATLTIEPGVTVQFAGDFKIVVSDGDTGTLHAVGTPSEQILFTTDNGVLRSASIVFQNQSTDATYDIGGAYQSGSILQYVTIEKIGSDGALVLNGAHPYISHVAVRGNQASGIRAYNIDGLLRIEDCNVESNSAATAASQNGGGMQIFLLAGGDAQLRRNRVALNAAQSQGGGIYVSNGGSLLLESNEIDANKAETSSGGGLFISGTGTTNSAHNSITNNASTRYKGGGVYFAGGPATFFADIIRGNTSDDWGAGVFIASSASPLNLSHSVVDGNVSNAMGGGVFAENSGSTISHSFIINNVANSHSGGIDLHGPLSVDHSIIAGNKVPYGGITYGSAIGFSYFPGTLTYSSIVQNSGAATIGMSRPATIQHNTITQNSSKSATVRVGYSPTDGEIANHEISFNNLFSNATTWDVYSNVAGTVNLPSMWWGTTVDTEIASRISSTDPTMLIDVSPIATQIYTDSPVSPPSNVMVTPNGVTFVVSWSANPETDVVGYRVHWKKNTANTYEGSADVPNGTSYELPVLAGGDYVVAVTAYDGQAGATSDDPATPVNEKQTSGHESWFSETKPVSVVESDLAVALTPFTNNAAGISNLVSFDLMHYKIEVKNLGPSSAASSMTVTLAVEAGITLDAKAGCTVTTQSATCVLPAVALNDVASITLDAHVGSDNKAVKATATVSSPDDPDALGVNNEATASVCTNCPDVVVTWPTAPTLGSPNLAADFSVSVKNKNRVAATNVVLDLDIPPGVSVNIVPACTPTATGQQCTLGDLAPGAQNNFSLSLSAPSLGNVSLIATATLSNVDSNYSNNSATVSTKFTESADLSVSISDNGTAAAQKQSYSVSVNNAGPATANSILATITLPAGLLAVTNGSQCTQSNNDLICNLGTLTAGAVASVSFTTVYSIDGSFELKAKVGGEEYDPNPSNNTASVLTTIGSAGNPDPGTTSSKKGGGGSTDPLLLLWLVLWTARAFQRRNSRRFA